MNLSKKLKQLRLQQGFSQKEVAAYLHRSVGSISNYENGVHEPDYDTLCMFADLYGVTTDFLLGCGAYRRRADITTQPILGKYSIGRLLMLLPRLSRQDKILLVYFLRLLEKAHDVDSFQN